MKNTFGSSVSVTIFGESHGEAIGAVIDGLCPGIEIDNEFIERQLEKRRPALAIDTKRREKDEYRIISGVFEGRTTGTPLTVIIPNEDKRSDHYQKIKDTPRPSHADYTARCKYHGFEDYRGGGHFSGRITAALVAAGAICTLALKKVGVSIATHILSCGGISDREFSDVAYDVETLIYKDFPVLSDIEEIMTERIIKAKLEKNSLGGVLQTAICGVPAGVGEPWFDSCESLISHAIFSIGGIKGIEFGRGFELAKMKGSEANDAFRYENGKVVTATNNSGGINGGITNGMPIIFNCAVKPTPSISATQKTVNLSNGENTEITIEGRHDPAIIRRVCHVVDAVSAICICDMLAQRFGTDCFMKNGTL